MRRSSSRANGGVRSKPRAQIAPFVASVFEPASCHPRLSARDTSWELLTRKLRPADPSRRSEGIPQIKENDRRTGINSMRTSSPKPDTTSDAKREDTGRASWERAGEQNKRGTRVPADRTAQDATAGTSESGQRSTDIGPTLAIRKFISHPIMAALRRRPGRPRGLSISAYHGWRTTAGEPSGRFCQKGIIVKREPSLIPELPFETAVFRTALQHRLIETDNARQETLNHRCSLSSRYRSR